jgi:hypothetical protein
LQQTGCEWHRSALQVKKPRRQGKQGGFGMRLMRLLEFLEAPKMDVGPLIEGVRDRGNIGR